MTKWSSDYLESTPVSFQVYSVGSESKLSREVNKVLALFFRFLAFPGFVQLLKLISLSQFDSHFLFGCSLSAN